MWFYPDLCLKPLLESGFNTMRFRCPDSLVSCRKADSCKKKYAVSKISGFEWALPQYLRHHDFVFVHHVWIHHPHEYATAVSNCQLPASDDILELFKEQYPSKQKVVLRLLSAISL